MNFTDLIDIFQGECNYKRINEISNLQMRNHVDGVQLHDAIYYRFLYSKKDTTKENIVSSINNYNCTSFSRQAFDNKENNIPVETYLNIFHKIRSYYNCNYNNENGVKLIGIDGTYNNNVNMDEVLNMGFYDITNGVPIDIKSYGHENKNREISSAINYINNNLDMFKNNIIVGDRGYFSYEFLNFLITNNIKFIIRTKGEADNLQSNTLRPSMKNYNKILNIKKNSKVIKYDNILQKTICTNGSKKGMKKHILEIKNECVIVTNRFDDKIDTDAKILELYKSRWDIEVLFKYVQSNYKFQHIKEHMTDQCNKMYICELIITYIAKIIEKYHSKKYPINKVKKGVSYKINKSNLVNGIFDYIIYDILNNKLTSDTMDQFCRSYIKIIQNKDDRSMQ